jgi:hypothetical protein
VSGRSAARFAASASEIDAAAHGAPQALENASRAIASAERCSTERCMSALLRSMSPCPLLRRHWPLVRMPLDLLVLCGVR